MVLALPRRLLASASASASRYGPAWLLLSTLLSWANLLAIYLALRASNADIPGLVRAWKLGPRLESAAETGGVFALAVVLNKMLSPLRFLLCLALLSRFAPRINAKIERWTAAWRRLRGSDIDGAKHV